MERAAAAGPAAESGGVSRRAAARAGAGAAAGASSRQASSETLDSPTGSHVEWCKQLIAATISSQISGSVPSEGVSRDYRVSALSSVFTLSD